MKPRIVLDESTTPEGSPVTLCQQGSIYHILVDGVELMQSHVHGSEEVMVEMALQNWEGAGVPRVLVGGLGMGYTLRAVLDLLPPQGRVEVSEVLPKVIEWNRGVLGPLAGHPLDDPRVVVREGDLWDLLVEPAEPWDIVLLDVDNGPSAFTLESNHRLYGAIGVTMLRDALRSRGVLVVWSSYQDPKFEQRLKKAGLKVRAQADGSPRGAKGAAEHHLLRDPDPFGIRASPRGRQVPPGGGSQREKWADRWRAAAGTEAMKAMRRHLLAGLLLVVAWSQAGAWGIEAHHLVNETAIRALPEGPLRELLEEDIAIVRWAGSEPDRLFRHLAPALEAERHFMHIDAAGSAPWRGLPRTWEAIESCRLPPPRVLGRLPVAAREHYDELVRHLKDGNEAGGSSGGRASRTFRRRRDDAATCDDQLRRVGHGQPGNPRGPGGGSLRPSARGPRGVDPEPGASTGDPRRGRGDHPGAPRRSHRARVLRPGAGSTGAGPRR